MRVYISISEEESYNRFANIDLNFEDESINYSKRIHIDFYPLYIYTKDTKSIAFDLFLISIISYNIDCLLNRYLYSIDGWRRLIEVEFPVVNYNSWIGKEDQIKRILDFLTGDNWIISFKKIKTDFNFFNYKKKKKEKIIDISEYNQICLFSGGLDSLAGILKIFESNSKTLLCSHYSKFEKSDQENIKRNLQNFIQKFDNVQFECSFRKRFSISNHPLKLENTFRSRSFLFLGAAIYLAYNISSDCPIYISENGTITLNIPLTKSRQGSCSTKTTHPNFIKILKSLLIQVGISNPINNMFEFMTKGEILSSLKPINNFNNLIQDSVSCGKRGHKVYWKRKNNISHCGVCMPCFYRRAALHMFGLDNPNKYGRNIFNDSELRIKEYSKNSGDDFRALLHYLYVRTDYDHDINQIKRDLIINGLDDFDRLDEYAQLIQRTRQQLKNWIENNQNDEIRDYIQTISLQS